MNIWALAVHIPSTVVKQDPDNGCNDSNDQIDHLLSIFLSVFGRIMWKGDTGVGECSEEK
jgi:hypothetical protein